MYLLYILFKKIMSEKKCPIYSNGKTPYLDEQELLSAVLTDVEPELSPFV